MIARDFVWITELGHNHKKKKPWNTGKAGRNRERVRPHIPPFLEFRIRSLSISSLRLFQLRSLSTSILLPSSSLFSHFFSLTTRYNFFFLRLLVFFFNSVIFFLPRFSLPHIRQLGPRLSFDPQYQSSVILRN